MYAQRAHVQSIADILLCKYLHSCHDYEGMVIGCALSPKNPQRGNKQYKQGEIIMKTSDIYSVNLGCRSNNDAGYQAERRKGCVTPYPLIKDEIVRSSGNNSSSQTRLMRRHNMLLQVTGATCPKEPLSSHWFNLGTYSDDNLQAVIAACPEEPSSSLWFYSGADSDEDDKRLDTESRRSPENLLGLRNHKTTEVETWNLIKTHKVKKKKRRR